MTDGYYAEYNSLTMGYCNIDVKHTPRYTSAGTLESYDYVYDIRSWNGYSSTSDMVTRIGAIRTALAVPGQTLTIKDTAGTTVYSFGATDCNGDGPYVEFDFPNDVGTAGNCFWLHARFLGNVPPGGSGNIVNDYEDSYSADATGRYTWTRTGTLRNSSAWADQVAALASADPSPDASLWEYVSKDGKLDEDKKQLNYTFIYAQYWEKQLSEWKETDYTISISRNGNFDEVTFNGTVKPSYSIGAAESLEERAISWARGKMPGDCHAIKIDTNLDKRNGSCAVMISAMRAKGQTSGGGVISGDIVEHTYSDVTRSHMPHYIHRPLNGDPPKADVLGEAIVERTVSGRAVGLTSYPRVNPPTLAFDKETAEENPTDAVDGSILYPMTYSYTIYLNVNMHKGGGGGGAKAVGGNGGIGGGHPPDPGRNVVTFGDIGGFTTSGTVNGVIGGLFGTNPKTVVKFRIT